jgi:membrane-bound lytic murein transglycosylase B
MYTSFTMGPRLRLGRECLETHQQLFAAAEQRFQVSRYVLAALLLIETHCGKIVGNSVVLERLARVSSVGEPSNIDHTFQLEKKLSPQVTREAFVERARYLEDLFLPEVKALIEVANRKGIDIFSLRGSIAGAFGMPQFLPSSYLRYGIDGNDDGKVDLFDPADAIPSAANYLHSFGWKDDGSFEDKKAVLWHYNRSDAYGEAVLKVSILLKQEVNTPPAKKTTKTKPL